MPPKEEWDEPVVYDCRNNPNWNDEALKKCRYKGAWLTCAICCNEEICDALRPATSPNTSNFFQELLNATDTQELRRMESYNRIAFSPQWLF